MKLKLLLGIIVFLAFHKSTNACINYYVINETGRQQMHADYPPYSIYINNKYTLESLHETEKAIKTADENNRYQLFSNYCADLIKLGRCNDALNILKKLYIGHNNEYQISSNLAVAFELTGQLDSALYYMKQSLRINPDSHEKTEWFHVKYLEAAIKENDGKLDLNQLRIWDISLDTSVKVGYAISHQLKERIPLTSSPNKLLSKVIEEAGDYYRKNISINWSIKLYAIAHGYSNNSMTKENIMNKIIEVREKILTMDGVTNSTLKKDQKWLRKSTWKKRLNQDINVWSTFKSCYTDDLKILDYN